ncbi:MAG: YhcN/YlaJ family sporulation lipoprotein [Firmicutes bacterium]|nr:YhcN/YlaJ family sporulation lipoprotein [Bacillota bacterium]
MKKQKFFVFVALLLVATLFLSSCSLFRRPEAERQPAPEINKAPNSQVEQQRLQQQRQVVPQEQPQDQPRTNAQQLAERIADIATEVDGVDQSVVVVISNLALVGVTLEREETAERGEEQIKREVARRIEKQEPSIVNAYVSANPDIIKQLRDISQGIERGEPISSFFDQITDVLNRMRAETGNNNNNVNKNNNKNNNNR